MIVTEVNVATGQVAQRTLAPEEQQQRDTDAALAAEQEAQEAAAEQEERDVVQRLMTLRDKARLVRSGEATFTAAESQKILAGLVLRATR